MLVIKNNLMASNAARHLGRNYSALASSVQRLSSGLRINSAKDDAAGLAVRELMRADVAVIKQGSRNANDGISMLQTMEGAMASIDDALIRMKELAEQAATGSYSDSQRTIMNNEFAQMASEITRIAGDTKFNSIHLLDSASSANNATIHFGVGSSIGIPCDGGLGRQRPPVGYNGDYTQGQCPGELWLHDEQAAEHQQGAGHSGRESDGLRIAYLRC